MRWIALPVLALAGSASAALVGGSDVRLIGNEVHGRAARDHRVERQVMEVVETEGCDAGVRAGNVVRVSETCKFLRGIYHYRYRAGQEDARREAFLEFSLTRAGAGRYALLVADPVLAEETAETP